MMAQEPTSPWIQQNDHAVTLSTDRIFQHYTPGSVIPQFAATSKGGEELQVYEFRPMFL